VRSLKPVNRNLGPTGEPVEPVEAAGNIPKEMTTPQLSIAVEGGAGTAVPDLSIEVDGLDEAMNRIQAAGIAIEYGPVTEDWGVRRFYVATRSESS
jgi:catechol 2,3-dioxygenase-like lactoylglutathione lyase family enzyme